MFNIDIFMDDISAFNNDTSAYADILLTHKNMNQKSSSTVDTIKEREVQIYLSSPVTPTKNDAMFFNIDIFFFF